MPMKKIRLFLLSAMMCVLCVGQAGALEYTIDAPEDYLFGRPTSEVWWAPFPPAEVSGTPP